MKYLKAQDIADRLQVSQRQAYYLMRQMKRVQIGRTVRVREEEFESFVNSQEQAPL